MTNLKELSFEQLCAKGSSYLVEEGYTQVYDMNLSDGMFYVFPEISGDMAAMCPGCSQLIMIGYPNYQGIFGKCDTKENRETTVTNLISGAPVSPAINISNEDNFFFVALETGSTGSPEQSKIDLANVNLEQALNEAEYSSFENYLEQNGYTNTNQSLQDFMMSKPPVEYKFASGTGAETPFPDDMPAKSCSKVVLISQFYYDNEQRAGYYFECKDEKHAEEVNSYFLNVAGDNLINNQIYGTAVFVAMYGKTGGNTAGETPDQPTVSRRSLLLRSVISTPGTHLVEIAPYNAYGEGPRTGREVDIKEFSLTKDIEGVSITYDRKEANTVLSCGMQYSYIINTTIEGKMLPESIVISGASQDYKYTRAVHDPTMGYLNINHADGPLMVMFYELPDYEAPVTFKKFVLQTTDGKVKQSFETQFSNWKDFANNSDMFEYGDEIKCVIDGVAYVVNELTVDGKHVPVAGDTAIEDGVTYYLIVSEGFTFNIHEQSGRIINTFTSNCETWGEFVTNNEMFRTPHMPEETIRYIINEEQSENVFYYGQEGEWNFVNSNTPINASTDYHINVDIPKIVTLESVDKSVKVNLTLTGNYQWMNFPNFDTRFAIEGSNIIYTDPETDRKFKVGTSPEKPITNLWSEVSGYYYLIEM
jgi:hypothetical protein